MLRYHAIVQVDVQSVAAWNSHLWTLSIITKREELNILLHALASFRARKIPSILNHKTVSHLFMATILISMCSDRRLIKPFSYSGMVLLHRSVSRCCNCFSSQSIFCTSARPAQTATIHLIICANSLDAFPFVLDIKTNTRICVQ